jgi:hypothetical protein
MGGKSQKALVRIFLMEDDSVAQALDQRDCDDKPASYQYTHMHIDKTTCIVF